jgi:hypothetical protein
MNELDKNFRERLLQAEQLNPSYKAEYEKEVHAMIEKRLTGITKWAHIWGLIMGLGFAVIFGTLAVIVPKEFPLWARAVFAMGAVFGLATAVLEGSILKKGTFNLRKDNMAMAGLGWGFVVIVATLALVFTGNLRDRTVGIWMLVSVLFYEVAAASMLLRAVIERSELNIREKLLEIEYRLAEIADGMVKKEQR